MQSWERLLDELRSEFQLREDELELLHAIDVQLLGSSRPLNATFSFIVDRSQNLVKSDHTSILLRHGRYLATSYSTSKTDFQQRVDISTSPTGHCLATDATLNIHDLGESPWADMYVPIQGYSGPPMRSLLATPLRASQTMVGVLSAESIRPGAFRKVHEDVIEAIAAQVGLALQHVRVFDQNTLRAEVDRLIFEEADSPRVIQLALEKVMAALRDLEHIELTDALIAFRRGRDLEIVHSTDPSAVGLVLGTDESICGRAVRERRTVVLGDVNDEPEYRRLFGPSIQSEIAVPILLGDDGVVIGVLNIESEERDAFQGFAQIMIESFAERVRMLLAIAKLRSDVTETMELRNASDLIVAVGDQASNMVHRMNNTVGAMRMRVLELQDMQKRGEPITEDFLAESLDVLLDLAEETLEMPKEITELLSQQSNTVNMNDVITSVLAKTAIPADVIVSVDLSPDLPPLSMYCFDVVVQNLIQNALDAMRNGGTLTIETNCVSQEELPVGYVDLIVRDTGSGIPEDILPHIFELNFTTKGGKKKGLGLGLWWTRNFIRRARGEITITSSVNEGTEVTARFPAPADGMQRDDLQPAEIELGD